MSADEDVFAARGGERFHDDVKCKGLLAGFRVRGRSGVIDRMSVGDASVLRNLKPCEVCFPGFEAAIAVLPSPEHFGHRPVEIDSEAFCARCRTRWADEFGDDGTYPSLWPCGTAEILGIVRKVRLI